MSITKEQILKLAPHADARIVDAIVSHADGVFTKYKINTLNRLNHLFAHMCVESFNFSRLDENLNYSAQRLMQVWPNRFPTLAAASPYAHNPQALANKAYGGRLGNTGSNDGWLFRGQGLLQTTGRSNVTVLANHLGVPVDVARQMLTSESGMLECAVANFVFNGALPFADKDDIDGSTKAVNGGLNGLAERKDALRKCKSIFTTATLTETTPVVESPPAVQAAPVPVPAPPTAAPDLDPDSRAPLVSDIPPTPPADPDKAPDDHAEPDAEPGFFQGLLYKCLGF